MSDVGEQLQLLSFLVGGDEYALEILQVREIISVGQITRLPRVPDFVRGLLNLRGTVVPVVDLARRLGFDARPDTPRSCIVVTELEVDDEWTRIGLLTDDVGQMIELDSDDIEPAPTLGAPVEARFLRGVGRVDDRFVLLLDPQALVGGDALRAAWQQVHADLASDESAERPADLEPVAPDEDA